MIPNSKLIDPILFPIVFVVCRLYFIFLKMTFRHKSVKFFTENCEKFLKNEKLDNLLNLHRGY